MVEEGSDEKKLGESSLYYYTDINITTTQKVSTVIINTRRQKRP